MFYTELKIESDLNKLTEVEHFIDNLMTDFNIDYDYIGIISTPLIEAVSNAIIHGNQFNKSKKVTITCQLSNKNMVFSVSDEGNGFNFSEYLNKEIENRSNNGLSIIELLTNKMEFLNNGNTITYEVEVPIQLNNEREIILSKERKDVYKTTF
ncbi:MAG TPA: ATP-binding protein [Bacteroidales bacterium]|jgi:serine/threonine-protein kinase RsbW|nr:ATP-binding protein [Bacteroidales bacterium]HOR81245.1 ATP-binding protein [Bacteroidales bacterium]HPJ90512.1 ATP-binding protein [Bacteroidales bacterium]